MGKFIDLAGMRFGRLVAVRRIPGMTNKRVMYGCVCDCGNEIEVRSESLRSGHTQSCGCRHSDIVSQNGTKHGHCKTRLYRIWGSMVQRCENPNNKAYSNYGGRGISICSEWRDDFETFYRWSISNGYNNDLQIDRINNHAGYSPENCRFVTRTENSRNRRCTKMVTFMGETKPLPSLCEELGVGYQLALNRINALGWSVEKALTLQPKR